MKTLAYISFGWLLTVLVSWCAGRLLLRRLGVRLFQQEEHAMAFLLGSATLSILVFLLCAVHLAYKSVFLVIAVLVLAVGMQQAVWRSSGDRLPCLPAGWRFLYCGVYCVFGIVYLICALAPEASPDGSTYHLGLVARYAREHGFPAITNNFYASLPQGMEMLFLFAFVWGRHSATALVHCTYLLLLPFLVLNYGRRLRMPGVGVAGGLLVFTAPVAGIAGTSAYNDVAVAAVAFAVFALLEIWYQERQTALLIPIGALAGYAFALKYPGFIAALYAITFVGYVSWRARKTVWRPVLLVAASAAILVVPTLAKNWIVVANPVSPFFNRVFPNPYVHVAYEEELKNKARSYDVHGFRELIQQVTVLGDKTQGLLGPIFLLAPLSLLALRSAPGRRLLLAALIFLIPYPSNLGTRFLLPAATFFAPGIALGLTSSKPARPFLALQSSLSWRPYQQWHTAVFAWRLGIGMGAVLALLVIVHAFLSWPSHIPWYSRHAWRLEEIPVAAALRLESEDKFLFRRLGAAYEMVRMTERLTPPGSRIYALGSPPLAYGSREFLCYFCSALNRRLLQSLSAPLDANLQPTRTLTFHFSPRRLRGLRLVQIGAVAPVVPGIHEWRTFGPDGELQPQNSWLMHAHPFPWDVSLAFDRNPVTCWSAWQEIDRGAWIAVEFEQDEEIAAVALTTSPNESSARWQLEGKTDPASWFSLNASSKAESEAPLPDLRRAATQELKRNHIQYLWAEMDQRNDFQNHAREWGVRLIAESQGILLYQIE